MTAVRERRIHHRVLLRLIDQTRMTYYFNRGSIAKKGRAKVCNILQTDRRVQIIIAIGWNFGGENKTL